ncbi:Hypothetical predicted protein [Mytilus galloprovincialis]|uniref:PLA2c domain-containing protein n=1 Tax=Mytilus galloprovincialis TaxID=29158 RepID=A0A8B6G875_MYTGA|nr:Hypothetical predicted protein [Mytilus galloprovincialis]
MNRDVKVRNQLHLCEDEEIFFEKRRKIENKELEQQRLDEKKIFYNLERVPNIAVIWSGGGMRAVVGMCGAMVALKELGILDAAMYTAGVSGSSCLLNFDTHYFFIKYLSTLYANKHEIDPTSVKNSIQEGLQSAPETFIRLLMSSLEVFIGHNFDGNVSLTDIYGDKVDAILLGKECVVVLMRDCWITIKKVYYIVDTVGQAIEIRKLVSLISNSVAILKFQHAAYTASSCGEEI